MSKTQLSRLIDLPDQDLQQILDYASTLSKPAAADHFKNLLGESPMAVEFISAFNGHRQDLTAAAAAPPPQPTSSASDSARDMDAVPKHKRAPKKKRAPLHMPAPRQLTNLAPPPGAAYNKKDHEDDYISGRSGTSTPAGGRPSTPVSSASSSQPPAPVPAPTSKSTAPSGGSLIQDALAPKSKSKNNKNKSSGPGSSLNSKNATKVTITGGTAMHGASTALAHFDAAIRALEISTNPTLNDNASGPEATAARRCNCVATRHPLQEAAPNCLHCGKVICVKEGLGPCTFCGHPLLTAAEVQAMIRELRMERGREKMAADRAAHQRPDGTGSGATGASSSAVPKPTMIAGTTKWGHDDGDFVSLAEAQARAHRDKLLAFQSQNAQRTTVRDEAADVDVDEALAARDGSSGPRNLWASPAERAQTLQRQQKLLRAREWEAKPDYEKRQQVLRIDVVGKKVFRKTTTTVAQSAPPPPPLGEQYGSEDSDDDDDDYDLYEGEGGRAGGSSDPATSGGTFSKNPLLGRLIKPVYVPKPKNKGKGKAKSKGKAKEGEEGGEADGSNEMPASRKDDPQASSRWRRVQDDLDDNEAVILDGGLYGSKVDGAA